MADPPLVSVIVPTRDRPALLLGALASLEAQTYRPIEVVVVDDGSAAPVALPHLPGIDTVLVRNDTSLGPGGARNAGVSAAHGDLIAFLDDDDRFTPRRIEMGVAGIGDAPFHAVRASVSTERFEGDMRRTLETVMPPLMGQVLLRRSDAVPFDATLRVSEDIDWWLQQRHRAIFSWSDDLGLVLGVHDGERPGVDPEVRLSCRTSVARRHHPALGRRGRALQWRRVAAAAVLAGRRFAALRAGCRSVWSYPSVLGVKVVLAALRPRMPG